MLIKLLQPPLFQLVYSAHLRVPNFKQNVLVKHVDNKLNAENLDLSFQNNLMSIYNNIVYQNLDSKLLADKLEVDLITKDAKIIMNDTEKKSWSFFRWLFGKS